MNHIETLRLALEALVEARDDVQSWGAYASEYFQKKHDLAGHFHKYEKAITALRQALEQPRQECETCANKRRRLEQAGFLKSPLRGGEKQFFYGQDPNVLPASNKGESHE